MSDVALLSDDDVMGGPARASLQNVSQSGGPALLSDDDVMGRGASAGPPKQDVDLATRAGMAGNRSAFSMLSAPYDAARWAARGLKNVAGSVGIGTGADPNSVSGEESYKKSLEAFGSNFGVNAHPDSAKPAATLPEKAAEALGSGAVEATMTGGAAGLFAKALGASASFGAQLTRMIAGSGATSNALMGAGAGAAGVVAEEAAPESLKPLAKMGGELVGGGVTGLLESGARAAVRPITQRAGNALAAPFVSAEEAAARKVLQGVDFDKQGEFRTALANAGDDVPGSNPTLFQATGDVAPRLGELERTAITKNPAAAMEVRQEQNSARLKALNREADPEADTGSVVAFVRGRLDDIAAEHGAQVAKLRQEAESGAAGAGGTKYDTDAAYGGGLEGRLDTLDRQRGAAEDRVWTALRETAGNKAIPFNEVTKGIADLEGKVGRLAEKPAGREKAIYDTIRGEGEYVTFNDIADIRSRITTALREDKELTGQARGRLRDAMGIVDGALDAEVARVAADPSARTILLQKLGVDGLTADDVAQYGVARAATRERKEATGTGVVGNVVAGKVTESLVPQKLLKRPEDILAFIKAADGDKEALDLAQDYLAFDMRKMAMKDGMISPQKLSEWSAKNAEALRQFPEMAARFANASKATAALDEAIAKQKAALDNFQTVAASKFLGDKDPHAALEQAMNTPEAFKAFMAEVKKDPAAHAGMKRLAVELILRKGKVAMEEGVLTGAKEAGTSGDPQLAAATMQNFFINNRSKFADIFDKDALFNIGTVMADIRKGARSEQGVRIPGQSNTAQDLWSITKAALWSGWEKAGTAVGMTSGVASMDPFIGAPTVAAGIALDAWRTAYRGRMDAALADIMLDARKAQIAIPKVIARTEAKQAAIDEASVARRMRALLGQEVVQAIDRMDDQRSP